MATANLNSGYVVPESIRIFFDAANDVVRITSNDEDFGAGGLNTALKKDSLADRAARLALTRHGISTSAHLDFDGLPEVAERVQLPESDALVWQVGTGTDGPVLHTLDTHLLIRGACGSGKTYLLDSLIEQLSPKADIKILSWKGDTGGNPYRVSESFLGEVTIALDQALAEYNRRVAEMRRVGVKKLEQLRASRRSRGLTVEDLKPVIVVIDETEPAFGRTHAVEEDMQSHCLTVAAELARKARSADVHLVLSSMSFENSAVPSAVAAQCDRIGLQAWTSMASLAHVYQAGLERITRSGVGLAATDTGMQPFIGLMARH